MHKELLNNVSNQDISDKNTVEESQRMIEIMEYFHEGFEDGSMLMSVKHHSSEGNEIHLEVVEKEWLPYMKSEVHLLTPHTYNKRNLLYSYVEELIQIFPQLSESETLNKKLLQVVKAILSGFDFLTQEQFINNPFGSEQREELYSILNGVFLEGAEHSFLKDTHRPILNKGELIEKENKIYCLDKKEDEHKIYLGVAFKKPVDIKEEFKNIGYFLHQLNLEYDRNRISYEEKQAGMTNHQLHDDLVFCLNNMTRTLCWLLNSTSWKKNKLLDFDKIDICRKLGI